MYAFLFLARCSNANLYKSSYFASAAKQHRAWGVKRHTDKILSSSRNSNSILEGYLLQLRCGGNSGYPNQRGYGEYRDSDEYYGSTSSGDSNRGKYNNDDGYYRGDDPYNQGLDRKPPQGRGTDRNQYGDDYYGGDYQDDYAGSPKGKGQYDDYGGPSVS